MMTTTTTTTTGTMTTTSTMTTVRWVAYATAVSTALLCGGAAVGWQHWAPLPEDCWSLDASFDATTTGLEDAASPLSSLTLQQQQQQHVHDCFCEAPRVRLDDNGNDNGKKGAPWTSLPARMAQPSNSLSNLAFVVVAFWAAARTDARTAARMASRTARSRLSRQHSHPHSNISSSHSNSSSHNSMRDDAAYARLFCTIMVALFFGSAALHASLTMMGRWLDLYSMYCVALYHALYVVRWQQRALFFTVFGGCASLLAVYTVYGSNTQQKRHVFTYMMLVALGGEVGRAWCGGCCFGSFGCGNKAKLPWRQTRYLAAEMSCLLVGWLFWQFGDALGLCRPTSLWQTHALWHVACAGAAACFFLYATSEGDDEAEEADGWSSLPTAKEEDAAGLSRLSHRGSESELTEQRRSSSMGTSSSEDDEERDNNADKNNDDDLEAQALLRRTNTTAV
jgi:hypothetical protein